MLKTSKMPVKPAISLKVLIFCILWSQSLQGQPVYPDIHLCPPLDIPLSLSSSFGEVRVNYLHYGIDLRTQGKTGFVVRAVDSGYVSRVKIEPGGYGRAVYITHPTGFVSVYAHLEKLRPDIDEYVKNEQYKAEQFAMDLFPPKDLITVKKCDSIAWSGNAGSSTGPHLHFEMRDEKTQEIVNVTRFFSLPIQDNIPPSIEKLYIYPINENSRVNSRNATHEITVIAGKNINTIGKEIPEISGEIGFGIKCRDLGNSTNSATGVYEIEMYVNNALYFKQEIDRYSFAESRYSNSVLDYERVIRYGVKVNRLFIQPNNKFRIYPKAVNNGLLDVQDTSVKKILVRAMDAYLNKTELEFYVKGKITPKSVKPAPSGKNYIHCKAEQVYTNKNIRITFHQNSLYDNLVFKYSESTLKPGYYSGIYHIHNKYTPIHQAITVQFTPVNLPSSLYSKALVANIDNQKIAWTGGEYKNGAVEADIRTFGDYVIMVDTVPPKIVLLPGSKEKDNYSNNSSINVKITDEVSGISAFRGTIDGKWVLFEYDSKFNLLSYDFDPVRFTFGQNHKLDLVVTDVKGNSSELHTTFYK